MCRVVEEMKLLLNVSHSLQAEKSLADIFQPVLKQMAESLGLYRGTVRILNRETGEILIDEAFGLTAEEMAAGRIQLGEGVIGQVVKTGRPAIVPDIEKADQSLQPDCAGFSGQSLRRPEATAFLCVPIIHGGEVMGTLSGYRRCGEPHALEGDQRLLTVTAQLIAQAARLRQTNRENLEALRLENERLQEQIRKHFKPDNMIGNSRAMQIVYNSIEQVAGSNTTVLIRGESGVGKELVAHAIHMRSSRALKPLVKVNCAALPETIVESELFGHERGAFTGADARRMGLVEFADGGTLFLDEVGELPLPLQAKLLRVLQERRVRRVGARQENPVDVRVVAATSRNVDQMVERGEFRRDLYYRINVVRIDLPPLRVRGDDIGLLAEHFANKAAHEMGRSLGGLSTDVYQVLRGYHWPGNVRELQNVVRRAIAMTRSPMAGIDDLPDDVVAAAGRTAGAEAGAIGFFAQRAEHVARFEKQFLADLLARHLGDVSAAAREARLPRGTLYRLMKGHGLDGAQFRGAK